ncbi:hypothetical protein PhaeoP72_02626 [Phaeobacter inhibens]|uniref:hypothetical protein n=1 Tax=Phaeobacter inhibens TaxID=221822 RepID=UPI000C9A35AF|nr:hypothetical protein [Phaeobacter inhibens]AUR04578.1 hypothetical protein PhaeoP72_02626 [Phaeobacter inhibens]UWR55506.1 hypothetical protein K4F89_10560 [Phaeobacter inhibens]
MSGSGKASEGKTRDADNARHRVVNWEVLRAIGGSPLATISIAMPFIGYAILYNDQIVSFLSDAGLSSLSDLDVGEAGPKEGISIGDRLRGLLSLEVITRLNFLYVGSFLVGVGTIIFRLSAPKTIQQHRSIEVFFDSELDRASARRLRTMAFTVRQRRPKVAQTLINVAPWLDRDKTRLKVAYAEMREQEDSQLQADVLSSFYNVESRYSNRPMAYVVFVLYILGFALISVPGICFTGQVLLSIFM